MELVSIIVMNSVYSMCDVWYAGFILPGSSEAERSAVNGMGAGSIPALAV